MMGGEQSHERTSEEREEEAENQQAAPGGDGAESAASEDAAGELPQCRMGNRKVDNMCFMIACTNWY
ncbi:hypothetical protein Q5P01_001059 [Channa striata]|uniref:Uncharacterized protein n=1 Tax=Channa striata TaxID=64152 RepID=A0AA88T2G6_CHASR|nr:hypothetical protein Q5P01_001059 [Channa striata]